MGDFAVHDMPSSRVRSSNRNLRSHINTAIKSEASMYGSADEDGEGEEDGDLTGMMAPEGVQGGQQASSSTGVRKAHTAIGSTRTSKSRVKGESSQKRKEQNRIAQRAFRKRQKVYFIDLEKEVIEKTGKIQAITKSNQSLMEMMERLQRENIALKAAKAPNFAGVPLSSTDMVLDENSTSFGGSSTLEDIQETGLPLGMEPEEDVLVSVNDLAGQARAPSRAGSSTSSSSASTTTIVSPIPTQSSNKNHKKPVARQPKKKVSDNASRRKLSSRSGGSISQTSSVLDASTSPRQMSIEMIDAVPEPRRRRATAADGVRVTKVINNPTWGMNEYPPPAIPKLEASMRYPTGGGDTALDLAGNSPISPISTYDFASHMIGFAQMQQQQQQQQQQPQPQQSHQQQQQSYYQPPPPPSNSRHWEVQQGQNAMQTQTQQQRDQADKARSARRYSEALQRHHAGPLMGHLNTTAMSSQIEADRPRTAESEPGQNRGMFEFHQMEFLNGGVFNGWQWNGQDYLDGQRIPFSKGGMTIEEPVSVNKQAGQGQIRQPMTTQYSQYGNDMPLPPSSLPTTTRPSQTPRSASPRPTTFAEMIPGLKHESNGTIMPFTGVLTPIDGFGSFDNPFKPPPSGAHAGQLSSIWRDLDDLNVPAFGLEDAHNNNNNSITFAESPTGISFNL